MKKTRERMKQELEGKASDVIEKLLAWHDQHEGPDMTQIEESALPREKQDVIRYCTLQIARLAGENG